MCGPLIVMAAVAVVSAVASYVQADKAASKQEKAIQEGIAADRAATAEQYKEINKVAMDNQAQLHTSYLIDSARIRAIQSESGMQGASADRVTAEAENSSATDMATLESNRVSQQGQASRSSAAQANRANLQMAGINRPSAAGTALQIGGAVASAYSGYDAQKTAASKSASGKP